MHWGYSLDHCLVTSVLQSTDGSAGRGRGVWLATKCNDATTMAISTDMFLAKPKSASLNTEMTAGPDQVGESALSSQRPKLT